MSRVNAWTQWGKLRTIVVGAADNACYAPNEPSHRPEIKDLSLSKHIDWPLGKKKQSTIDAANKELNNLSDLLQSRGIKVLRPEPLDFTKPINAPGWSVPNMLCCVCPRDTMITVGNYMIESTLSKRSRFF